MGKHRSPTERLDHARQMVAKYTKTMAKHRSRADRMAADLRPVSNLNERRLQTRAESLVKRWKKEVARLEKEVVVRAALQGRAPARPPTPLPRPQPTKQEVRAMERRKSEMAAAGVTWDPATAIGRRSYEIAHLGGRKRATIDHYGAVVPRKERTAIRQLAWEALESHFGAVYGSSLPGMKYEASSPSGAPTAPSEAKLMVSEADTDLRRHLGEGIHSILDLVVGKGMMLDEVDTYTGTPQTVIERLIPVALDMVAAYWRISDQKRSRRDRKWSAPAHSAA